MLSLSLIGRDQPQVTVLVLVNNLLQMADGFFVGASPSRKVSNQLVLLADLPPHRAIRKMSSASSSAPNAAKEQQGKPWPGCAAQAPSALVGKKMNASELTAEMYWQEQIRQTISRRKSRLPAAGYR